MAGIKGHTQKVKICERAVLSAEATVDLITSSGAGFVAAGKQYIKFFNPAAIGGATVDVDGVAVNGQESVIFKAYLDPVSNEFKRLPEIAYNGTGGVLNISFVD